MRKTLTEVLQPLSEKAQRFLCYRVLGFNSPESLEVIGVGKAYADNLRQVNEDFRTAENYLLENRQQYIIEAAELRQSYVKKDGLLFLDGLISKARENPEQLRAGDKRIVLSAISLAKQLEKRPSPPPRASYDKMVLERARREQESKIQDSKEVE